MIRNKKSKKISIWSVIGNTLFYAILVGMILICVIMVKAKIDGKQPSLFGNKFFIVLTGSMSPTINVGDLVVAKESVPNDIKPNDVITFGSMSSDNITTHRVKEVLNDNGQVKYVTQGDANNVQDPLPVNSEVLMGKVVKVVPKIGNGMLFVQKNIKAIAVGFVAIFLLSGIGIGLKKYFVKLDNEEIKSKNIVQEKIKEENKEDLNVK